ncbi:MAG: HEPN domain-containing protein [Thaumarchaeota archaeon]|nr:HEPN domain-containing protein [Nitrososphaerota archaeon]
MKNTSPGNRERQVYGDTPESAIRHMADIIVERFSPVSVTLFGSRARGDADGHSDVDLFIIMPEGTDVKKAGLDIRNALSHSPIGKDVLVNTPDTFARYAMLPGTVQRKVVREGVLLHGDLDSYADAFMRNAGDDLRLCEEASSGERHHVLARAYHSQQAAEKALKCALVLSGVDFERTHDLKTLAADLSADWGIPCSDSDLDRLSEMVVTARYGNGGTALSKSDADWAFGTASDIVRAVRGGAAIHGAS